MKRTIPLIITVLLLFAGGNLTGTLGIERKIFNVSLVLLSLPVLWMNRGVIFRHKPLFFLIAFLALFSAFKLYTDRGEGTRVTVLLIICAPLFIATLPRLGRRVRGQRREKREVIFFWRKVALLYFLFFVLEVGLALLERITSSHFLAMDITGLSTMMMDHSEFRSYSLHGHPLQNALIVSTSMAFILMSPLKPVYKYAWWGLGFLAILCFNTRSSMVGNALIFGAYTLYMLFIKEGVKAGEKRKLIFFSVAASLGAIYLVLNTGMGGRLINHGLFDDSSAIVRVNVWNIFDYFSLDDFTWGTNIKNIRLILHQSGVEVTENFWLDYLLNLGLVFLLPVTTLYFFLAKKEYRDYALPAKILTSVTFLLIASTNNSLSATYVPLFVYFLSILLFNPRYIHLIVPPKYLEERKDRRKRKTSRVSSYQQIQISDEQISED